LTRLDREVSDCSESLRNVVALRRYSSSERRAYVQRVLREKLYFAIERTSRLDQTMECGAFFDQPLLFLQSRTIQLIGPRSTSPLTRLIGIRHRFGLVPFSQRCFKISLAACSEWRNSCDHIRQFRMNMADSGICKHF
jgi:hypothetical protein